MERLTMIDGCGNYELARCMDCGLEKAGADLENCGMCEEGWQRALKRLAAYEDTGLEPEDLKKAFNETAILKLAAQVLRTTPYHLRDLLQAEQDGRLVVMPCKVGDHVWAGGREAIVVWFFGYKTERYLHAQFFDNAKYTDIPFYEIGKTVFLAREEAEAALKGGEG